MESSGEETERLTGRKTQPKSQVRNLSDREKSKHKDLSDVIVLGTQMVKKLPAMQETEVWSLGQEDPLEEEMATDSSILAWKIPWATVHRVAECQTWLSAHKAHSSCRQEKNHLGSSRPVRSSDYIQRLIVSHDGGKWIMEGKSGCVEICSKFMRIGLLDYGNNGLFQSFGPEQWSVWQC